MAGGALGVGEVPARRTEMSSSDGMATSTSHFIVNSSRAAGVIIARVSEAFIGPPPNTRVQRTRPSPSAPHSPLTRHPLGGKE